MTGPHLTDVELVGLIDGEGPVPATVADHLQNCMTCRHRREEISSVSARLISTLTPAPPHDAARLRLRAALRAEAERARGGPTNVPVRWAMAAAALLAAATLVSLVGRRPSDAPASAHLEAGALPIRALTPGAVDDVTRDELCRVARAPQPLSAETRARVLHAYGMTGVPDHEYELDFLITPELGGAADPQNLWPEPYGLRLWNAKVKDELEDLLATLVCAGRLDLRTAQRDIASDWVAAYRKYFKTQWPRGARLAELGREWRPRPALGATSFARYAIGSLGS